MGWEPSLAPARAVGEAAVMAWFRKLYRVAQPLLSPLRSVDLQGFAQDKARADPRPQPVVGQDSPAMGSCGVCLASRRLIQPAGVRLK